MPTTPLILVTRRHEQSPNTEPKLKQIDTLIESFPFGFYLTACFPPSGMASINRFGNKRLHLSRKCKPGDRRYLWSSFPNHCFFFFS